MPKIAQHTMDRICVLPFSSPPEMAAVSYPLTSAFQARLVQRGLFRLIKNLPYEVKSDTEALWYARSEGCELVMIPSLLYTMDGTGAMHTKLVVRTRILPHARVQSFGISNRARAQGRVPMSILSGLRSLATPPRGAMCWPIVWRNGLPNIWFSLSS